MIKYTHGCNYYGVRDIMIKNNIVNHEYPRYNEIET